MFRAKFRETRNTLFMFNNPFRK